MVFKQDIEINIYSSACSDSMGNGASVDHGAKAHLHHKIKHEIPQCAICLAAMTENMSSLKCGHTYHTQWFTTIITSMS